MFPGIKPRVLIEQGKLLVFLWLAPTCHPPCKSSQYFILYACLLVWECVCVCVCVCERERERERENICQCVCMCGYMMGKCIYKRECMGIWLCVNMCVCVCIDQNQQNLAIVGLLSQGPKIDIVRRCWHIFHISWSPYYYLFISWGNETPPGKHHRLGQLLPYVTNCSMMV